MFNLIRPGTDFDFVGKRKIWIGLSLVFIGATFALFYVKGLNLGIDFMGGAEIQIRAPKSWDIGKLRSTLEAGGMKSVKVVQIGTPEERQFLVRASGDDKTLNAVSQNVSTALSAAAKQGSGDDEFTVLKEEVVGAVAGGLLAKKGFLAVFYALLVILIYVGIRFDIRYAPGAVMALFHDTVIVLGVFILTQKQFDLTILAAILALVGYSNNDTIIVFDRVRETQHLHPEWNIEKTVNVAINETLGRTIMTSLTTFIVVFALWLFGGSVIHDFAFTFMVGIVVGTYSSIFIASSLVIALTHYQAKRGGKSLKSGGGKSAGNRSPAHVHA